MVVLDPLQFAAIAMGSEGTTPKPDGNHLRWSFRTGRGFPARGFTLYRRESRKRGETCLELRREQPGRGYQGTFTIGDFTFDTPAPVSIEDREAPAGRMELWLPSVQPLRIFLPVPAMRVRIAFIQYSNFRARAFAGQVMVDEVVARRRREVVVLSADFIDRIEIDAQECAILELCITPLPKEELDEPRRHGWEFLAGPLDLPPTFADGVGRILGDPVPIEEAYREWMGESIQTLLDPTHPLAQIDRSLTFIDGQPGSVPLGTDPGDRSMLTIYPLKMLLLAALDPDIARFLGLGFVDETANPGQPYDYLMIGHWDDDDYAHICYGVVRDAAPILAPPAGLTAEAFAAAPTTASDTGLAVGLRWTLPLAAGGYLLPHSAVWYDAGGLRLANASDPTPALPGPGAFPGSPLSDERIVVTRRRLPDGSFDHPRHFFTHGNLGDGWYGFRIKGYDIFGRESDWSGPVLARVLDTIAPPSPRGMIRDAALVPVEARYLQPGDPELTATDRALIIANGGNSLTVVEWDWFAEQQAIAPDTAEFRIYQHDAFADEQRQIVGVGTPSGQSVTVTLDASPTIDPVNGQLSARGQDFLILARSGASLTVRIQRRYDVGSTEPVAVLPRVGPATIAEPTNIPSRWAERRHAQPVATPPVGHYQVVLPGAVLTPLEATPVINAWVGVTAVDNKSYIPDDPARSGPFAGRTGNESVIGSRARIWARYLPAPGPGPQPAGPIFATRADFHGRSRYRLTWTATSPNRYHVHRAVESGVIAQDLRARRARTGHYVANSPFVDDPGFAAWLTTEFPALTQADLLAATPSAAAEDAWTFWTARFYAAANLPDASLSALADRAGNEQAFIQLTSESLATGVFDDEFDGLIAGRYLYRTQIVSPNGLRGPLSPTATPVHLRDVLPPRAPVIERLTVADRAITVEWAANTEADLDHYEVYRTHLNGTVPVIDPRRMQRRGGDLPPATRTYADSGVLPAREYLYTLVAVDTNGNRSDPAIARQARGIALTPPAAAVLTAARVGVTATVNLSWTTPEETARSLVQRRVAGSGSWAPASGWLDAGVRAFTDPEAPTTDDLEYRVTLLDAAGNRSAPSMVATVTAVP